MKKKSDECGVKRQGGGEIKHGDRQQETAKQITAKCKAFIFPFIRRSLCCWLKGAGLKKCPNTDNLDE